MHGTAEMKSDRPQTGRKYLRHVDGLRAIAIIPVLLFHAGFGRFTGGYIGVDVFFVISGFLITRAVFDQSGSYPQELK